MSKKKKENKPTISENSIRLNFTQLGNKKKKKSKSRVENWTDSTIDWSPRGSSFGGGPFTNAVVIFVIIYYPLSPRLTNGTRATQPLPVRTTRVRREVGQFVCECMLVCA